MSGGHIKQNDLQEPMPKELAKLIHENPFKFFDQLQHNPNLLEGKSYKSEAMEAAWKQGIDFNPQEVRNLLSTKQFAAYKEPYEKDSYIAQSKKFPDGMLYLLKTELKDKPYRQEIAEIAIPGAAEKNPDYTLSYLNVLNDKEYKSVVDKVRGPLLETMAKQHPQRLFEDYSFNNGGVLKGLPEEKKILDEILPKVAKSSPQSVLMYYFGDDVKQRKEDPAVAASALKIAATTLSETDPGMIAFYAYGIENKNFSKDVFSKMASSASDPKQALFTVNSLNGLHDFPDAARFTALKHYSASQEFDLITHGRQEIFTSTYQHISTDMMEKMRKEKTNLPNILSQEQKTRLPVFLEAAASYNKLDQAMQFIPKDQLPEIVHDMGNNARNGKDLSYVATMANMMSAVQRNPELSGLSEAEVKQQYENAKTQEQKDRFGLIAVNYSKNSTVVSNDPETKAFYQTIQANPRYDVPAIKELPQKSLVDKQGANNQLMVFSDDKDSKDSFNHWKATYKGKAGWKMEDKGSYVEISSTGGKTPVHIYANDPEYKLPKNLMDHYGADAQKKALEDIRSDVGERQGVKPQDASFQVFTGRGHSTHAIEYNPAD